MVSAKYKKRFAAAVYIIAIAAAAGNTGKSRIGSGRVWSKQWYKQREVYTDMRLLRHLRESDRDDYRNYLRMNDDVFRLLLGVVAPAIMKKDTVMRRAITAEERLVATLRYLATVRAYENLKFSMYISPQALRQIIPETCKAIIEALKEYIQVSCVCIRWNFLS